MFNFFIWFAYLKSFTHSYFPPIAFWSSVRTQTRLSWSQTCFQNLEGTAAPWWYRWLAALVRPFQSLRWRPFSGTSKNGFRRLCQLDSGDENQRHDFQWNQSICRQFCPMRGLLERNVRRWISEQGLSNWCNSDSTCFDGSRSLGSFEAER